MKLKWYDLEWEKTDDIYFYLLYLKKNKICFKIASCQIEVFLFSFFNITSLIWILSSGAKTKTKCEETKPDFQHGRHFLVVVYS